MSVNLGGDPMQTIVKVTIVLITAWFVHAAIWKWNPRWRVFLWRVTSVGVAVLLAVAAMPPLYHVPLLSSNTTKMSGDSQVVRSGQNPVTSFQEITGSNESPKSVVSTREFDASDVIDASSSPRQPAIDAEPIRPTLGL